MEQFTRLLSLNSIDSQAPGTGNANAIGRDQERTLQLDGTEATLFVEFCLKFNCSLSALVGSFRNKVPRRCSFRIVSLSLFVCSHVQMTTVNGATSATIGRAKVCSEPSPSDVSTSESLRSTYGNAIVLLSRSEESISFLLVSGINCITFWSIRRPFREPASLASLQSQGLLMNTVFFFYFRRALRKLIYGFRLLGGVWLLTMPFSNIMWIAVITSFFGALCATLLLHFARRKMSLTTVLTFSFFITFAARHGLTINTIRNCMLFNRVGASIGGAYCRFIPFCC